MSVNSVARAHGSIIQNESSGRRYSSNWMLDLAKKIVVIAPLVIALANLPGAEAGPITYAACMAGVIASGPAAPGLWASCLLFLGPWCP